MHKVSMDMHQNSVIKYSKLSVRTLYHKTFQPSNHILWTIFQEPHNSKLREYER